MRDGVRERNGPGSSVTTVTGSAAKATSSRHGRATSWTPIGSGSSDDQPPRTTTEGQPVRLWTSLYVSSNHGSGSRLADGRLGHGRADDQVGVEPREHPRADVIGVLDEGGQLVAAERTLVEVDPGPRLVRADAGRSRGRDQAPQPGVTVGPDQAIPGVRGIGDVRRDLPRDRRPGRRDRGHGGLHRGDGLRGRRVDAVVRERDHAERPDLDPVRVAERDRRDVRVDPVGPGDDREDERQVVDAAGDRPELLERRDDPARSPASGPVRGTRPCVGLIPATPQTWDGWRMLSPVSLPMSNGAPPAATIAAAPPELPPGVRVRSYGFDVRP